MIRPPLLAPGPEVTWLLRRAYAPLEVPVPRPNPSAALQLVEDLGLAGRLWRRVPMPQLEAELGIAGARSIVFQNLQLRAANRVLALALQTVLEVADRERIDVVLLKHAALWQSGTVEEGERDARDLDLLVSVHDADLLWRRLREMGYRPLAVAGGELHLTPLISTTGACVELHHQVWGIELQPRRPTTLAVLLNAGLTSASPATPHAHVPERNLLIAHALVHGLAQHLTSPADYAPLRVFGDLISLGGSQASAKEIQRYIHGDLDAESVEAALEIAQALATGSSFAELSPGAAELFSHVVAASTNRRYRLALRAHRLLEIHQRGELLQAAKRFFRRPISTEMEDAVQYRETTFRARMREAWELVAGLLACVQLRKRRASSITRSATAGSSCSPARPKA